MNMDAMTMALSYNKNIFGFAVFDNNNKRFLFVCDILDTNECDILKSIVYKLNIDCVLVPLSLDDGKFENLKQTSVKTMIVDQSTFAPSKKRLFDGKEYKQSSKCLNALLIYLDKNFTEFAGIKEQVYRAYESDAEEENMKKMGYIHFYPLYLFQCKKYLYLNTETMDALSLLKTISHPNIHIRSKSEDNSLYKVLKYTYTTAGAELLRQWICFPLLVKNEIETRRSYIEFIIARGLTKTISELLKNCKTVDLTGPLHDSSAVKRMFGDFLQFLYNSKQLISIMACDYSKIIVDKLVKEIETNVEITNEHEFVIKANVNTRLDELKDTFANLDKYLDEAAIKCSLELKTELVIVYFPQLGYLIETSQDVPNNTTVFVGNEKKYYKNSFMHLLDQEIGDVYNRIKDEEVKILHLVIDRLNCNIGEIRILENLVARIDCYNSLAIAALKFKMTKPVISDKPRFINIRGLYNILCRKKQSSYVINDYLITGSMVITGPNGSGKSSFLKNVGIIVVLNQIGSYLPCEEAFISLFDGIFSKIISIESLELKRSAFLSDVIQCSNMCKLGSPSSLALIDEFGKGTNISDGCSLFLSLVQNLKHMTAIFVTHYNEHLDVKLYENIHFITIKNFTVRSGVYENEDKNNIIEQALDRNEDFDRYLEIRKKVKTNTFVLQECDDTWAIKVINEFLQLDINKDIK